MLEITATIVNSILEVEVTFPSIGSTGGAIEVYLDGVLNQSVSTLDFSTETVNISI